MANISNSNPFCSKITLFSTDVKYEITRSAIHLNDMDKDITESLPFLRSHIVIVDILDVTHEQTIFVVYTARNGFICIMLFYTGNPISSIKSLDTFQVCDTVLPGNIP